MLPGCGRLAIPALPHPPRTSMLWLRRPLLCLALLLYAVAASAAAPKALRVASAFDPQTMDPHALALLSHWRVAFQLYESLLTRDENFELEAGLATAWHAIDPTTWRFSLRAGVTFHDGTPFSADDAVFSLERALATPSQRAFHLSGVRGVRKVDNLTVELQLSTPDAMLPVKLQFIAMMSRPWAIDHGVERAQDFNGKQETFAVRNANGTGPFRLDRYEPDVRTELRRHPGWRGWKDGKRRHGNLDEVELRVDQVRRDAARRAGVGRGRSGARSAVPGRRAAATRAAAGDHHNDRYRHAVLHLRPGDADRRAAVATGRRHVARARVAVAVRPGESARAAEGSRLSRRLRGDARLRQHRVSRERLPGRWRRSASARPWARRRPTSSSRSSLRAARASSNSAGRR